MEANKTILQMKYARIVPIFAEQTGNYVGRCSRFLLYFFYLSDDE